MIPNFSFEYKSKFEIFGFYFGTKTNDKVHNRIVKSCDNFLDISSMDDKKVVELSKNLDIDIAIDLMAHSGTINSCLLYTSPSPRDRTRSRMPSSA